MITWCRWSWDDCLLITYESVLTAVYTILISILSGIYSGVIVSRYSRFAELRNEVLRIIRSIDFMDESSHIAISKDEGVSKLQLISSDFIFLKHSRAASLLNMLAKEIQQVNYKAKQGQISIDDYSVAYSNWQALARKLPANNLVLWSLWAKL